MPKMKVLSIDEMKKERSGLEKDREGLISLGDDLKGNLNILQIQYDTIDGMENMPERAKEKAKLKIQKIMLENVKAFEDLEKQDEEIEKNIEDLEEQANAVMEELMQECEKLDEAADSLVGEDVDADLGQKELEDERAEWEKERDEMLRVQKAQMEYFAKQKSDILVSRLRGN